MRIWKMVPVLFLLAAGACSEATENPEPTPEETAEPASPASNAGNSAPAPATKPAEKPAAKPASANAAPAAPAAAPVTIPAGTKLTVILNDELDSGKNQAGDAFKANLGAPVMVNGKTVLAKGTQVQGKVVDAKGAGRVKGLASMSLELTSVMVGGKSVPLATQTFATEAEATKGKDAAVVGGGAGLGTAIGALAGGKKGAVTGAIIGGAAGTGTVLATKGKEVEFAPESKLEFALSKDLTVTP
ncbi:MAG TPA: hypothetical protein VFY29_13120 [Terriglobia bacterium]|nr:hypothetical protein [Terriglobia bacterium]